MDRNSIEDRYKWDLTRIYKNIDEFNKEYEEVYKDIEKVKKYEDNMMDSGTNLYNTLETYYGILRRLEKLSVYTHLLFDEDTSNNDSQALLIKVSNLDDILTKSFYYYLPTLFKYDYSKIEEFYKNEPKLLKYEILLKHEFRYKDHSLSDEEEKLISNMGKMFGNNYTAYELLKDSDLTFGTIVDEDGNSVELTCSNYNMYIESKDRRVREDAFRALYKIYKQFTNTFASVLTGNINERVIFSKIKHFNSAIEASLYADEVNEDIYNNLISSVNDNMNILFKYYKLKKDLLRVDELHLYDIYVKIVDNFDKKYDYEEAKDIVIKALSVLGDDYINTLMDGWNKRWIDVYPTSSKRTGGYSSGCYDTEPYILLNYQGSYSDMSTLAHESGHSMHSYYARSNNDYIYGDYSIFVAEVASTVNELLLAKYLLNNSKDKKEKLFILDNLMNLYKSTIYRQTMFAEFEQMIYRDSEADVPLTSDYLSSKYYDLNKKYFGDDVVVDEDIRYEWERIPHFYYNFYVYKYATGLSAASKIVKDILDGKENAVSNYISFLKTGSTKNPIDSLKVAGVDLTKKEVIDDAIMMFDEIIEEFKKTCDL